MTVRNRQRLTENQTATSLPYKFLGLRRQEDIAAELVLAEERRERARSERLSAVRCGLSTCSVPESFLYMCYQDAEPMYLVGLRYLMI